MSIFFRKSRNFGFHVLCYENMNRLKKESNLKRGIKGKKLEQYTGRKREIQQRTSNQTKIQYKNDELIMKKDEGKESMRN